MLSKVFLTSETRDWAILTSLGYTYDIRLVLLSCLVAMFASYAAFHLVVRVRAASNLPAKTAWLVTGASSMGGGIWSMHFIGMLAVQIAVTARYDIALTGLSVVFAIVGAGCAFYLVSKGARTPARLLVGGILLGGGIGAMHYTGMAAMHMAARILYDPLLFALSVLVAVTLSSVALYLLFHGVRSDKAPRHLPKLAGGCVMGLSIAAMHYTAMTTTYFLPTGSPPTTGVQLDASFTAGIIAAAAFVIIGLALVAAFVARFMEVKERAARQSQGVLAAVVDNTADGIIAIDQDGIVRIYNPAAERMFGYDSAEIVGKNVSILLPPEDRDTHEALIRKSELGESRALSADRSLTGRRKDGSPIDLEISVSATHSDEGRMFISVCHDITERRQAEELSQRLGRILDSSFNEIYVFDAETFRFTQINQGAFSNLGYTMDELHHLTPWDLKPEFDAESFAAAVAPLRSGEKELLVFETEHRRKDASLYPVEVRLQLSWTETPPVFLAVVADITERKRAERAVHAAKEAAEAANQAKSEFLATMSHELRTPLNAIIGFSEIIKTETFGPVGSVKYRDYAGDIHESGRHLLDLINDILDLSKIESGMEEIRESELDIGAIADAVLRLTGQRAHRQGITLQPQISDDLPGLHADERKLKQILVNLLSNAIKFTEAGGTVTLKIWCGGDSGYVFQVIDTGIGIALADIPKALSKFGQVDSALNRQHDGTGLGLPLTKSLVELHGGCLDLQSQVGVGTTVTVRLPASRIVPSRHAMPGGAARRVG